MKSKVSILIALWCGLATLATGVVSMSPDSSSKQTASGLDGLTITCLPNQRIEWPASDGSGMCRGYVTVSGISGAASPVDSDTTTGYAGQANAVCRSDGKWAWDSSPSAICNPTHVTCPGGKTLSWGEGEKCRAVSPETPAGTPNVSISDSDSSDDYIGEAIYSCSTTGSWLKISGSESCNPAGPLYCAEKPVVWSKDGNACSGTVPKTPVEEQGLASDNEIPTTVSATFSCGADGEWSNEPQNVSCANSSFADVRPSCPLPKPGKGYLIDFTNSQSKSATELILYANDPLRSKLPYTGPISTIQAGDYWVRLYTYVNTTIIPNPSYFPGQEWKLALRQTDGTYKYSEKSTDTDMSHEDTFTGVLKVPLSVTRIEAHHAAPSTAKSPVIPLCASLTLVEHGACDITKKYGCAVGNPKELSDTNTEHRWVCVSPNGGQTSAECTFPKVLPMNGVCGIERDTCLSGDRVDIADTSSEYLWYCKGKDGGVNSPTCRASIPVTASTQGVCGSGVNSCKSGTPVEAFETSSEYRWKCRGASGGGDESCRIQKTSTTKSDPNASVEPTTIIENNTVVYDKVREDFVRVDVTKLGIEYDDGEIEVPKEVLETRLLIVESATRTPFVILKEAPPEKREEFVRTWLAPVPLENVPSENASPMPAVTLTRLSREEKSEEEDSFHVEKTEVEKIVKRSGLATLRDRDGDGVSDYDEEHVYGTDPNNPFTANSTFSDGERLLLGMNPTTDDLVPVVVDSPKLARAEVTTLYSIDEIEPLMGTSSEGVVEVVGVRAIKGKAQPFAFITLYIYSTPIIVTVQADATGKFEYVLEKSLEDGEHEVYIASVNNSGKILAQSSPIPFVKTAQAIEYIPSTASAASPVDDAAGTMVTLSLLAVLFMALVAIVWIGMHRARKGGQQDFHEAGTT